MLSKRTWESLQELKDLSLKELASKLPDTIASSQADTTARMYNAAFRRWKDWAARYKFDSIPAKEHEFALYLQHLADTSKSRAVVEEACNALTWVHTTAGLPSPASFPFICATKEGLQRVFAKPVVKKSPVTVEMLEALVEDAQHSGALADLRLATACLLAFAAFLRFKELVTLRPCDIVVQQGAGNHTHSP